MLFSKEILSVHIQLTLLKAGWTIVVASKVHCTIHLAELNEDIDCFDFSKVPNGVSEVIDAAYVLAEEYPKHLSILDGVIILPSVAELRNHNLSHLLNEPIPQVSCGS